MPNPSSDGAELPGQLGDFLIESLLGEGGSGVVYRARWGPRVVALKVLRTAIVPTESQRKRFYDEAAVLSAVDHPHIVKVLSFGELPDGRPYLAMELLEGETLATRLHRGPLAITESLALFEQLVGAVQALHDGGLIHRDLKPENVFLVPGPYVMLLDFGIAKEAQGAPSTVTEEGLVRGTPAYMAPERFFGQPASITTDLYELTVVLYAMLTAELPWSDAADPSGRLNPRRPSELGVDLPGALERELLRALSTRAESRPASVRELGARLAASVSSAPEARQTVGDASAAVFLGAPGLAPTKALLQATVPDVGGETLPGATTGTTGDGARPGVVTQGTAAGAAAVRSVAGSASRTTVGTGGRGHRRRAVLLGSIAVAVVAGLAILLATKVWPPHGDAPLPAVPAASDVVTGTATSDGAAAPAWESWKPPTAPAGPVPDTVWQDHPAETRMLLGVAVRKLRKSKLFAASHKFLASAELDGVTRIVSQLCGFDPVDATEWFSAGVSAGRGEFIDLGVGGDWDRQSSGRCLEVILQKAGQSPELSHEGSFTRIAIQDANLILGWPATNRFLVTSRADADAEWMARRLSGKGGARKNRTLRALAKQVDTKAAIWFAGDLEGLFTEPLLPDMPHPIGTYGTIEMTDRLAIVLGFRFDSSESADSGHKALQAAIDEFAAKDSMMVLITRDLTLETRGRDVVVQFSPGDDMSVVIIRSLAETISDMLASRAL